MSWTAILPRKIPVLRSGVRFVIYRLHGAIVAQLAFSADLAKKIPRRDAIGIAHDPETDRFQLAFGEGCFRCVLAGRYRVSTLHFPWHPIPGELPPPRAFDLAEESQAEWILAPLVANAAAPSRPTPAPETAALNFILADHATIAKWAGARGLPHSPFVLSQVNGKRRQLGLPPFEIHRVPRAGC